MPRIFRTFVGRDRAGDVGGYVYILTDKPRGVLYTGVTSALQRRVSQHRQNLTPGFSSKYQCKSLVWYERHESMTSAIQREKSIKRYRREWKLNLIEGFNPSWDDLFERCYERDNPFRPTFTPRQGVSSEDPRHGGRG